MLGSEVAKLFVRNYEIVELNRQKFPAYARNGHFQIGSNPNELKSFFGHEKVNYVINCAGQIRQKIDEKNVISRNTAVQANFELPLILAELSEKFNFKVIQIGTDCVFSGQKGNYTESDRHDAHDIYGKSKSAGEIPHENFSILRSSIVGKEKESNYSLMSWLLSQPLGATINGFNDQYWNGISVLHFAKFIKAIIENGSFENFKGVHHIVPNDVVSKAELLTLFSKYFGREDLRIESVPSGNALNMTLSTSHASVNETLWNLAGYCAPLTIEEMILEYSKSIRQGAK